MNNIITIKKSTRASQSYGRGSDQVYTPAQYTIVVNDKVAGVITARSVVYMESPTWTVSMFEGDVPRPLKSFYGNTQSRPFAKAREWAKEYFRV